MQKTYLLVQDSDNLIMGCMTQEDPDAGPIYPQHGAPAGLSLVDLPPEGFTRVGRADTDVAHLINGSVVWTDTRTIDDLKSTKNAEINSARLAANLSFFTFQNKQIACDTLSRSDIDAVNGYVTLTGSFREGWPGAWKAVDNTYVPISSIDDWKAFYGAMVDQGQANFAHAQELKAQLANATTTDEVAAITW